VSRELARRGARVAVVARNREEVQASIASLTGEGHFALAFDVSKPEAWAPAVAALDKAGPLNGVVTAAAELGPIGRLDAVIPETFERTIATNLLGTMLALHHTLPRLRANQGRAVTFSGGGATSPLPRYDAYAASKAAVARLTENVATDFRGEVEINSVAPGFVVTDLHLATLAAGPARTGPDYHAHTREQFAGGGFPAREAVELVCFLLSDEAAGISGRLISAQWDPWREQAFRDRLKAEPFLGTLRRIDGTQFGWVDQ
jgi:NAD(P)-dependent dehydrogenase (short-subunit alcohol dehydrogenase family)